MVDSIERFGNIKRIYIYGRIVINKIMHDPSQSRYDMWTLDVSLEPELFTENLKYFPSMEKPREVEVTPLAFPGLRLQNSTCA